MQHKLYVDGDANIPEAITDGHGQVALSLCKVCGKGEIELGVDCVPNNNIELPYLFMSKDLPLVLKVGMDSKGFIWVAVKNVFKLLNTKDWVERSFRKNKDAVKECKGLTVVRLDVLNRYASKKAGWKAINAIITGKAIPKLYFSLLADHQSDASYPTGNVPLKDVLFALGIPRTGGTNTLKQLFSSTVNDNEPFCPIPATISSGLFLVPFNGKVTVTPLGGQLIKTIFGVS